MLAPEKQPDVAEALRRIVAAASPKKVILFGSRARGEAGSHSDLDFLVVISTGGHRRRTAQHIYRRLVGMGHAADIVVVTEEDIEQFADLPGTVIRPALREGTVLYAA